MQLTLSSLEEQGGRLAASSLPLSEEKPQTSWRSRAPQDTLYLLPSISTYVVTQKGIGGLMLPSWNSPVAFHTSRNQASALQSLNSEISKEWSWGHQHSKYTTSINLQQTLTRVDLGGDLERGRDPFLVG